MGELALLARELEESVLAANARLDSRFGEAMNNKDIDAAMNCFTASPNLVVVLWGNVLHGPKAVRDFLAGLFARAKTLRGRVNEITRWQVGDTVFAVGTATYEIEDLDGTWSTLNECWTDARQNISGHWVYILDHATQLP